MSENELFPVPSWTPATGVDQDAYQRMQDEAGRDPDAFFAKAAERLDWMRSPTEIRDVSFDLDDFRIRWFADGVLNASVNCIDRHLPARARDTAIIWEADEPGHARRISYGELYENVCRMANVLRRHGVKKGDRVTVYLPMIPEAAYAMLACARIGAVHSVVFAGFSPTAWPGGSSTAVRRW